MRILGVDTTTAVSSVAFFEDGQLTAEATFPPRNRTGEVLSVKSSHSEAILPLISSVLDDAHRKISDIDVIAVSIGPGSFTGLRIGLALVKGIAYECSVPVVGVSSLEAQAARFTKLPGTICSLLDARKHEVYAALFEQREGSLLRCSVDQATEVTDLMALFSSSFLTSVINFVGNGAELYQEQIVHLFGSRAQIIGEACGCSAAGGVARVASARSPALSGTDLGPLVPLYLGTSQALGISRQNLSNSLK